MRHDRRTKARDGRGIRADMGEVMPDYQITTDNAAGTLAAILDGLEPGKVYDLTITERGAKKKKRSLDANAQIHVWFAEVSSVTGEDAATVKSRCKRDLGLPILFSDEQCRPLAWMLDKCGFWRLTDSQQLKLMQTISVTSLMTSAQCSEMRDQMRAHYMTLGIDLRYANEPPM